MNKELINRAQKAYSNINMYGAVMALCESSLFLDGRFSGERRIIKICKAEIQRELRIYDEAMLAMSANKEK